MPLLNRAVELQTEIAAWRHELHQHPELLYDTQWTSAFVAEKLTSFGCDEVVTGIGRTGVVGIIKGRHGRALAVSGFAPTWTRCRSPKRRARTMPRSFRARCMPAAMTGTRPCCWVRRGTCARRAILRARSRSSSSQRRKAVPAALPWCEDGLMERFGIDKVFGMHNWPGVPVGEFAIRPGPLMAAMDVVFHHDHRQGRTCGAAAP